MTEERPQEEVNLEKAKLPIVWLSGFIFATLIPGLGLTWKAATILGTIDKRLSMIEYRLNQIDPKRADAIPFDSMPTGSTVQLPPIVIREERWPARHQVQTTAAPVL